MIALYLLFHSGNFDWTKSLGFFFLIGGFSTKKLQNFVCDIVLSFRSLRVLENPSAITYQIYSKSSWIFLGELEVLVHADEELMEEIRLGF